jgi:hypothetical protein
MKKGIILIVFLALMVCCATAEDAAGPTVSPTHEMPETTDVTPEPTELTPVTTPEEAAPAAASWVWPLVFLVLGILVLLPWLLDTSWNIMIRKRLLTELNENKVELNKPENRGQKLKYYDRLLSSFAERKGMSRFSLMISVTLIIGAVMFYLVLTDPGSELLKSSLTVLTGALASIIGFYFGGRSGGTPADQAQQLEETKKELEETKKELEIKTQELKEGAN